MRRVRAAFPASVLAKARGMLHAERYPSQPNGASTVGCRETHTTKLSHCPLVTPIFPSTESRCTGSEIDISCANPPEDRFRKVIVSCISLLTYWPEKSWSVANRTAATRMSASKCELRSCTRIVIEVPTQHIIWSHGPFFGIGRQRIPGVFVPAFVTATPVARTFDRPTRTRSELPDGPFSTSRSSILPLLVLTRRSRNLLTGKPPKAALLNRTSAQRIPSRPGASRSNEGRIHLRRPTCQLSFFACDKAADIHTG
jgi:hypothetical protein